MSTFSIENVGDCDILYALLTDDLVKKIVNNRFATGTNSRNWWPPHSITKGVQLECALSEISDLLKDPVLDCKDAFSRAIANSALKLNKKFLLPNCKDSLSISTNLLRMLNQDSRIPYIEVDQQPSKHLPGGVVFYNLHSTPLPKKRTLVIRPKLSNSTIINIEMEHLPSHPLANLQEQPDGRHPLQTRSSQQEIMDRKPKYKVPNDDSIQRQNWYSYQNRVLNLQSSLWFKDTLPVEINDSLHQASDDEQEHGEHNDGILHESKNMKRSRNLTDLAPAAKDIKLATHQAHLTTRNWLETLGLLPFPIHLETQHNGHVALDTTGVHAEESSDEQPENDL